MAESEALKLADQAMSDDDTDKAQAILDRFDRIHAGDEADADAADGVEGPAEPEDDGEGGLFAETSAGMLNAFTEEETTEDDIGGYYHDLAFIFDSLTLEGHLVRRDVHDRHERRLHLPLLRNSRCRCRGDGRRRDRHRGERHRRRRGS